VIFINRRWKQPGVTGRERRSLESKGRCKAAGEVSAGSRRFGRPRATAAAKGREVETGAAPALYAPGRAR
jgi:hypothetical protein